MSSCPLISIMHYLTAVGLLFTAISRCAFGINGKCCDPSRQLLERTAAAHRAERAVSSKSQLIFSGTRLTPIIYAACLSALSHLSETGTTACPPSQASSCSWFIHAEASHFCPPLCSTWCLTRSWSWVGNTGSISSLPRSTCLLHSTCIWTSSPCSSSCCSSSASAADTGTLTCVTHNQVVESSQEIGKLNLNNLLLHCKYTWLFKCSSYVCHVLCTAIWFMDLYKWHNHKVKLNTVYWHHTPNTFHIKRECIKYKLWKCK